MVVDDELVRPDVTDERIVVEVRGVVVVVVLAPGEGLRTAGHVTDRRPTRGGGASSGQGVDGTVVVVVAATVVVTGDTVVVVVDEVVVVVVVVVVVASDVHTAYSVVLLAGIVIVAPSPYGVPLPNNAVFQPVNVKPDRVKLEPLLRVTDDPDAAASAVIDPEPLFELYVM